jgi:hypothetical protein
MNSISINNKIETSNFSFGANNNLKHENTYLIRIIKKK